MGDGLGTCAIRDRPGRSRRPLRAHGGPRLIAIDTNVLVHAHRTESPKHAEAAEWLLHLGEGDVPWAIPIFCVGEFVRIVTHRRVFDPPSTLDQALAAVEALMESPTARLLLPGSRFLGHLTRALREGDARGNLVFDAQIAAACAEHGVSTILTEDRDFLRFPGLAVRRLAERPGSE